MQYWTSSEAYILLGGVRMEATFEYEVDGVVYSEMQPPQKFINDLLNALQPFFIPNFNQAD